MTQNWTALIVAQLFFITVFLIGIPMSFSVKDVSHDSSRYQIIIPHNTLAKLIGKSTSSSVQCNDEKRCVTPLDRHHFLAHIPIIFEECEASPNALMCDQFLIQFNMRTSALINVGFSR